MGRGILLLIEFYESCGFRVVSNPFLTLPLNTASIGRIGRVAELGFFFMGKMRGETGIKWRRPESSILSVALRSVQSTTGIRT